MKNTKAKTRPIDNPYETYIGYLEGMKVEWRVLKHYKSEEGEAKDPFARVFTGAMSPATYGSWEYGDMYLKDLQKYAELV